MNAVIDIIASFQGEYRFLSNFWPHEIIFEGCIYPSVEHAYQAAKTDSSTDRKWISLARTPGRAKQMGKHVDLRKNWHELKLPIMRDLVILKFKHIDLAVKLVDTMPCVLVEGNNWGDEYWGMCNGHGANNLGRLLMEVRTELLRLPCFAG